MEPVYPVTVLRESPGLDGPGNNYTAGTGFAVFMVAMRTRLLTIPLLLMSALLASLYLFRWTIVGPLVVTTVERSAEQALGGKADVAVDGISGTLIRSVEIETVKLVQAAPDSLLQQLTVRNLQIHYRLSELLPWVAALLSPEVVGHHYRWALDESGAPDPAGIIAQLGSRFPRHLRLRADGSLSVATGGRSARSGFSVAIANGQQAPLALMELHELHYQNAAEHGFTTDRVTLELTPTPDGLAISVQASSQEAELLLAGATATRTGSGGYEAGNLTLQMALPGVFADLSVENRTGTGRLEISESDFTRQLLNNFSGDAENTPGKLTVAIEATTTHESSGPLVDTLLAGGGFSSVRGSLLVDARGWNSAPVNLRTLGGALHWDARTLELTDLNAEAEVTAVRAANGSASPEVVARARRLAWTPAEDTFAAERARLSFGGGEIRISGAGQLSDGSQEWTESEGQIEGTVRVPDPGRTLRVIEAATGVRLQAIGLTDNASGRLSFLVSGGTDGPAVDWSASANGLQLVSLPTAGLRASGTVAPGLVRLDALSLTFAEEAGNLHAEGQLHRNQLSARLEARDISAAAVARAVGWEFSSVTGQIQATLTADGPAESPKAELLLRGTEITLDGVPASLDVAVRQQKQTITMDTLQVDLGALMTITGSGAVPLSVGTGGLRLGEIQESEFDLTATGEPARLLPALDPAVWGQSEGELQINLRGTRGELTGRVNGIRSDADQVIAGIESLQSLSLRTSLRADTLERMTFSGGVEGAARELLSFDGTADLTGGGEGSQPRVTLTADLDVPLAQVSPLVPGVNLLGGRVTGRVESTGDPQGISGRLRISQGVVKFSTGVPVISLITGRLNLNGGTVTVRRLTAEMGSGRLRADGTVTMANDVDGPQIALQLRGDDLLLFRTPDLVVRADVSGSIDSRRGATMVDGEVQVGELVYSRPVQLLSLGTDAASPTSELQLFSVDQPWARSVTLGVRILADQTILVDNNLYNGLLSADLTLRGSAAVPRAEGAVVGTGGEVSLPTASLDMQSVEVRFPPDASFRPSVKAQATTRVQGYDLSVTIDGQFPNVGVSVASSPPLPTDEALILLSTGRELSELTFQDGGGTVEAIGTVLGSSFLEQVSGSFSGEAQELFDRFEFSVERDTQEGAIGDIGVQYQLSEEERWFLNFERAEDAEYTVELSWRLWTD
jgi:hypothetical protein